MQGTIFCINRNDIQPIIYTFISYFLAWGSVQGTITMGNIDLLKASAGSGKTYQLAYRYVKTVIVDPFRYRHILAVTFTNKATEEMKRRILSEIDKLASENNSSGYLDKLIADTGLSARKIATNAALARTKILHDYSRFSILTIDRFFQRIIRSFIKELGIDLNFNLELQTDSLLSSASDSLIEEISMNDMLRKWITAFVEERIEENRKWDIRNDLTKLGSELFRESYKKSGDIQVSKEKLAEVVAQANKRYFAIVSSMKADADKAIHIIHDNALELRDFAGGMRSFTNYFRKISNGDICAYGASVSAALVSEEKWCSKTSAKKNEIKGIVPQLKPLLQKICNTYDSNISFLNSVDLLKSNYRNFALLSDLSVKLNELCEQQNIVPISETNNILHKLISGNETPFIFEKAGNHFSSFMIDEFQDTSSVQWENFVPLLSNALSQSAESPVLLVGDIKQSIYRWRGGDWQILARGIQDVFPQVNTSELITNYRSFPNIIRFNNEIIQCCVSNENEILNNLIEDAFSKGRITLEQKKALHNMALAAYNAHAQMPAKEGDSGYITISIYDRDENDEYTPPFIKKIEDLQSRGYKAGDIAILVRTNADGYKLADMLLEKKRSSTNSSYIYDVVTQEALTIGSSSTVGFLIACMKLACDISDSINKAIYNKWHNRQIDCDIPDMERYFLLNLGTKSLSEAFESVITQYDPMSKAEDVAYVQAFHDQIIRFNSTTVSDIPLFLKWWEEKGHIQSVNVPQDGHAINIITIHKAKGLEYKAVIIPYCNWSLNPNSNTIIWASPANEEVFPELAKVPIGFSEKMRDSVFAREYFNELVLSHIDNINLFYVAVTRAREELHIMIPASATSSKKHDRISSLITQSIANSGSESRIGGFQGVKTQDDDQVSYHFGTPVIHATQYQKKEEPLVQFHSYSLDGRVSLRFPTEKYTEDSDGNIKLNPRDYGILMHRVFENASTLTDIHKRIEQLRNDGEITNSEAAAIENGLQRSIDNDPVIATWFSEQWDAVKNENEIILPGSKGHKTPDRVMIKKDHVVIVDYKFGKESPNHQHQIKSYMKLLSDMGYRKCDGYVWYISLGKVVQVAYSIQNGQFTLFS